MAAVAGEAPDKRTSTAEKAIDKAPSTAARTGRSASAAKGWAERPRVAFDVIRRRVADLPIGGRATETAPHCEFRATHDSPSFRNGHVPVQRHRGIDPSRRAPRRPLAHAPG